MKYCCHKVIKLSHEPQFMGLAPTSLLQLSGRTSGLVTTVQKVTCVSGFNSCLRYSIVILNLTSGFYHLNSFSQPFEKTFQTPPHPTPPVSIFWPLLKCISPSYHSYMGGWGEGGCGFGGQGMNKNETTLGRMQILL